MKTFRVIYHIVLLSVLLMIFSNVSFAGPFGFEKGMTKEQLIAKLGKNHVMDVDGDVVAFDTAPSPHPEFGQYSVTISPTAGLLRVSAYTAEIKTNDSGDQVRQKFATLLNALKAKYGPASDMDALKPSSIWKEPGEWMMGLLKKDRFLQSVWLPKPTDALQLPDKLTGILLKAAALNLDTASIALTYEFEGYQTYREEQDKKKDSVF